VFIATKRTQGWHSGDHWSANEGELVRLPTITCACTLRLCHRGVQGLGSRGSTTTFCVSIHPGLALDDYRHRMRDDVLADGILVSPLSRKDQIWLDEFIDFHVSAASTFTVGDVLELRDDEIRPRWRFSQTGAASRRAS
jgi:hypothetical protein